jgi:hypothetical protein
MKTPLADLQAAFADAIDDPAADAALAAHLRTPGDGLGLYRGNVRAARRAALASAYPVLAELTGGEYFDALATSTRLLSPTRAPVHRATPT